MKNKAGTGFKKITCLFLCLVLLLLTGAPQASANELDDLKAEYDRLTQKIADSEKALSKIYADKNKQQEMLKELNDQLDAIDRQMKVLNASITLLQTDVNSLQGTVTRYQADIKALGVKIEDTNKEITEKQAVMESTRQEALDRMRTSYLAGNPSKLEILLSSNDMSVFFYNMEMLKQLAKKDEALIDKLKGETNALNELKKGMEKDKSDMEAIEADLVVKLGDLKSKKAEKDAQADQFAAAQRSAAAKSERAMNEVAKLDKSSAAYKAQIARYEREREEADKRIDEYIAQYGSSSGETVNPENEGAMTWPVPYAGCYITSPFGNREDPFTGAIKKHNGIDICVNGGSAGKKIVAAQGGAVITAGWDNSYGNYVIIDHGGGLFTVYGHASVLVVSKGQTVSKGQKIAEIGTTGASTGPHLHFEVRKKVNGTVTRVNPMGYVNIP